jgi:hypothetical protein
VFCLGVTIGPPVKGLGTRLGIPPSNGGHCGLEWNGGERVYVRCERLCTHLVVTGFERIAHDDFAAVAGRWVVFLLFQAVALRSLLRILV